MTSIEWTEKTWNPATGCTKISPGCANCYAATMSKRLKGMGQEKYKNEFIYTEHPKYLDEPTKWKKPRMIFVNSMSDLFHKNATKDFLDNVFYTMLNKAPHHTYQILTKRPQIALDYINQTLKCVPKNIWIGTSVESADYKHRIETLQKIKAETKFISFEPLIGPLYKLDLQGIDWAIIGGESGPKSRPVKKEWIIDIIEQCKKQNVAVFFKQWGGIHPKSNGNTIDGVKYEEFPNVDLKLEIESNKIASDPINKIKEQKEDQWNE